MKGKFAVKSILKALYMGNLNISEGRFPNDADCRNASHSISDIKTTFKDKLSADDAATLEKRYNLQSEITKFET